MIEKFEFPHPEVDGFKLLRKKINEIISHINKLEDSKKAHDKYHQHLIDEGQIELTNPVVMEPVAIKQTDSAQLELINKAIKYVQLGYDGYYMDEKETVLQALKLTKDLLDSKEEINE